LKFFLLGFAFCAASWPLFAATTTDWQTAGFTDFLKGHLSGLSLSVDGTLQLGPSVRWTAALNQPAFWSMVLAPDGGVYAATGHQGKVFRITPDGKATQLWNAEQSEVFALCLDSKGRLYAASSPNGGLYRIGDGKAEEIWHSSSRYIWALRPGLDGSIYVATGEPGRIFRLDAEGRAELFYDTGQSNVTALAVGPNGHLYAGTDPNGLLYEIFGRNQGTIVYDSSLPEISAIAVDANGTVYAAAMGGAVATRSPPGSTTPTTSSSAAVVANTPTIVTVTEATGSANPDDQVNIKPSDQSKTPTSTASGTSSTVNTAVVEVGGVEKSAVYRISTNRVVETLRSSKEDNVYDLVLRDGILLFSTDNRGRIFSLQNGRLNMLSEPGEGETTHLLESGDNLIAAVSNPARVVAFGPPGSTMATYESPVHDGTGVARWGHIQWHGSGGPVQFRTRTGFAARPDGTWSAWSEPISDPAAALIQSPTARYIQWRAEWPSGSNARLTSVDIPYLPQNTPPTVRSISVASILTTNTAKTSAAAAPSTGAYSITVTSTGEPPPATATTTPTSSVSNLQTTQTQISWQADDPDGDKLVYSVYFRPEDADEWQLIRSRMFENTLLLDPDVFADGRYIFRVVASDAPSNPPELARETSLVSSPVLIDNTPPVVTVGTPRRDGTLLDLEIEAQDNTSPLRLCEFSLDAGFWQPVEAIDGVTDSPHERFRLHLEKVRPGEHLLVIRVFDSANNAGLAKLIVR
jgi:sugar lactone lactonase YvrE